MVTYKNEKWEILPKKVIITNRGIEEQHFTDDPQYYEDMENKHPNIKVLSVDSVEITDEMVDRLKESQTIPPRYQAEVSEYVGTGEMTVEKGHPLKDFIERKKKDEELLDLWDIVLFGGAQ